MGMKAEDVLGFAIGYVEQTLQGAGGLKGEQGEKGEKGEQGEQGVQGIQGLQGEKGEDGYPFLIYKELTTIDEFVESDYPEIGLMFMIKTWEDDKGYPIYRYTADGTDTPYSLITYMNTEGIKGEKGDKGDTGEQGIQGVAGLDGRDGITYTPEIGVVNTVESTAGASVTIEVDADTARAIYNFDIPKGKDGQNGTDGINGNDGADGFSPVITVTDIEGGHNVAIEDKNGVQNFEVLDGKDGIDGTPVGCIFPFAGINLPVGYLLCNGASYAVADYPDLYAVIGNTYGGDSTNFNVPDYRETVLVGVGENTTDTIASHDVYELGEFRDDQLQGHNHTNDSIDYQVNSLSKKIMLILGMLIWQHRQRILIKWLTLDLELLVKALQLTVSRKVLLTSSRRDKFVLDRLDTLKNLLQLIN